MVDRSRNQIQQGAVASQAARLPALPVVPSNVDPAIRQFLEAVRERLEVREGSRGNPFEAVVTKRDLVSAGLLTVGGRSGSGEAGSVLVQMPDGSFVRRSIDEFAAGIYKLPLYQNLMKRLDDQSRFDRFPEEIKALLLNSIADEAAKRGADVREVEYKLQTAERSLAYKVEEVTAAVNATAAGVRETVFAVATDQRAQAGKVTQLEASLGNYYQDGTPGRAVLETEMLVTADRTAGLAAEYMVKVQAGGAMAGFGLAAYEDPTGDTESAFIVAANKFAIVSPGYTGGPVVDLETALPGHIPFGVDGSGVYINGTVRINAGGTTLSALTTDTGVYLSFPTQFFKYDVTGTPINTSIVLTANLTGGLTGFVDWDVVSGYTGSLPADGTANTATINLADMTADAATFQITKVDGSTYTDTVTVVKLRDGENALTGILTNESHNVPANSDGSGAVYTGAGGTFAVYRGSTLLATPAVAFSYVSSTGFSTAPTTSINATTGVYSISGNMNADVATVTYRATVGAATIDKVFTLTRARQGVAGVGADAKSLVLQADSQVFRTSKAGVVTPSSITLTAIRQNSSATVNWSSSPSLITGTGTTKTLTNAMMSTNQSVSITATMTDGAQTFTDTVTIVRVAEGSDAVTAVLSNEAHTAPSNSDGTSTNLTGASTTMTIYVGATDDSSSWTYTTSATNVTITGTNTRNVTISGMSADVGYVDITASKSGYSSVTKRFTISKAKQGTTGTRGSLSGQTVVSSVIRWTGRTGGKALWAATSGTEGNAVTIDNAARDRIWVMLGNTGSAPDNSHLRIGDTITVANASIGATVAVTGYWSGSAWLNPGVMIDGNLLVSGTVSTTSLIAGRLTGFEINTNPGAGARLVLNEGGVGAGSGNNSLRGYDASNNLKTQLDAHQGYLFVSNSGSTFAVTATMSGSGTAIKGQVTGTTAGSAAVWGVGNYGPGLKGESSFDYGATLTGNATKAPLRLIESSTKPTNADTGGLMVYNDGLGLRLCVALGGTWYKINATYTAI